MFISKSIVRQYKTNYAIALFILSFMLFHYIKPSIAYSNEGGFRQFGLGYRNKTIIPIWGISIIFAILSYLAILFYLRY
jgi:hypothetical protein